MAKTRWVPRSSFSYDAGRGVTGLIYSKGVQPAIARTGFGGNRYFYEFSIGQSRVQLNFSRTPHADQRADLSGTFSTQGYVAFVFGDVVWVLDMAKVGDTDDAYISNDPVNHTDDNSPNTLDEFRAKAVADGTRNNFVTYIEISDEAWPQNAPPPGPAPGPIPEPTPPPEIVEPIVSTKPFTIEAQFNTDPDTGEGVWTDISNELYGKLGTRLIRTEVLHSDLQSVPNTCRINLFGSDRIAEIFNYTPRDLPIRIYKRGQPWFRGFVRGDIGASFRGAGICQIEVVDRSYRFNDEIDIYLGEDDDGDPWTELPISKAIGDEGLLTRILMASGVPRDELFMVDIDQTLPRFAVSADEEKRWNDILVPILFEYGYSLNVRPNGSYEMQDLFPREVTPVALLDQSVELEYSNVSNIARNLKMIPTNSTRVIWYPQEVKRDVRLFELTQGARDNFPCFVRVTAGRFYPQDASEDLAVYSVYQRVDGFDIVSAFNQKFEWKQLETIPEGIAEFTLAMIVKRVEEHHPLFSDIRLQAADTGGEGVITQYRITGDAVVRDNLREHRWVTYGLEGSKNIKEIKTQWIVNATDAERLSSGYTNWSVFSNETLSFEGENFRIGQIYDIRDPKLTKVNGLYRILQVAENDIGRQMVIAERIPRGAEIPG